MNRSLYAPLTPQNRMRVSFDSLTVQTLSVANIHTHYFYILYGSSIHDDLILPFCAYSPLQVMQVVREQIMRALTLKPNSLDQFKSRLQNLSYTEILKIRQSERMNQEDFQSRPIL